MILQNLHLPNFRAFKRLIDWELTRSHRLATKTALTLVHLAMEHGISREEAEEIVDMCCDERHVRLRN